MKFVYIWLFKLSGSAFKKKYITSIKISIAALHLTDLQYSMSMNILKVIDG